MKYMWTQSSGPEKKSVHKYEYPLAICTAKDKNNLPTSEETKIRIYPQVLSAKEGKLEKQGSNCPSNTDSR